MFALKFDYTQLRIDLIVRDGVVERKIAPEVGFSNFDLQL